MQPTKQPLKRPRVTYQQSKMSFPLVEDIYSIVPLPFVQEVPVPASLEDRPNALRLVRYLGGRPPPLPSNPYTFTIPGHTLKHAQDFAHAMEGTVRWTTQKQKPNKHLPQSSSAVKAGPGRPTTNHFKLEFKCPRAGHAIRPVNSRKTHDSQKIGCTARFTISHHITTNTLRVFWLWEHNHDPFSKEEMLICRAPKAVEKWLNDRVVDGLGWDSIDRLLYVPDLFDDLLSPLSAQS
ncbi:hypothetical protein PtB15_1B607 [Puccinia triticina]|nr:hypothetical protein PtB15_1B607 [Puccinia triticina]